MVIVGGGAAGLSAALVLGRARRLREYGVDPSRRVLGALAPAVWEGALDRETWDHVRSVLLDPERLTTGGTPTK